MVEVGPSGAPVMRLRLPDGTISYRWFKTRWMSDTTAILGVSGQPLRASPLSPNPTRGATSLVVNLLRGAPLSAKIYDLAGRVVADVLEAPRQPAGLVRLDLDLTRKPAGMYFLKLVSGRQVETRKIARMR
jgi:hypothetical protein